VRVIAQQQNIKMEPSHMKPYDNDLVADVEELLEKVVIEEVTSAVLKTFEQALEKLDPQSRELLENHLNGASTIELSKQNKIPQEEVERWLCQIKRELNQNIRKDFSVRQ
jgi:DNA-directed RNA polymerase specialized sigma24 family protein